MYERPKSDGPWVAGRHSGPGLPGAFPLPAPVASCGAPAVPLGGQRCPVPTPATAGQASPRLHLGTADWVGQMKGRPTQSAPRDPVLAVIRPGPCALAMRVAGSAVRME